MKKVNVKVAACLLAGALLYSSCIGSFSLFNSYAKWQCNMTNSKFVNAIVGFVLMPIVGSVTWIIDWVVLNTIEFWSGTNPMQANIGKTQQVLGGDGRYYAVTTTKNGYEVKAPSGEVSYFTYDKKTDAWTLTQNGETRELFRFGRHHHDRSRQRRAADRYSRRGWPLEGSHGYGRRIFLRNEIILK